MKASTEVANVKRGRYVVETENGQSLSMSSGKFRPTIRAVVKFEPDGKIAHFGSPYWAGDEPKTFKANAAKMAARYQAYLDRTGKRFEIEQAEKRAADKEEKLAKARKARQVRDAAADLLEACRIARRVVKKQVQSGNEPENLLRTLDAAIDKATK